MKKYILSCEEILKDVKYELGDNPEDVFNEYLFNEWIGPNKIFNITEIEKVKECINKYLGPYYKPKKTYEDCIKYMKEKKLYNINISKFQNNMTFYEKRNPTFRKCEKIILKEIKNKNCSKEKKKKCKIQNKICNPENGRCVSQKNKSSIKIQKYLDIIQEKFEENEIEFGLIGKQYIIDCMKDDFSLLTKKDIKDVLQNF